MEKKELLKGERIERVLSPHPLSFMKLQTLCIFVIVWGVVVGWLVNFSAYTSFFGTDGWRVLLVWGIVLLLVGVAASLIAVQWTIFFLYLGVFLGGTGLMLWQNWLKDAALFIPFYSVAVSIIGFLIVEMYRRSHKYILTTHRIILKGGIFTKRERTIRYEKIADIDSKQGILGQIFGFGTIIPVSQSGLGLGSDKSFAGGGVEVGGTKAKLFGFAGGGKDVQTPIARSYYELHGVYPYKDVKKVVEDLVQSGAITPYQQEQVQFQKEQVDIQKQMRDLLHTQVKGKPKAVKQKMKIEEEEEEPDEEEEIEEIEEETPPLRKIKKKEEVEAFPPDQVDIQQQMKELLKKQKTMRKAEPEEEEQEEEEEEEKPEEGREVA